MDINPDIEIPVTDKPLAGTCQHEWQELKSPYLVAQICPYCRLFRYKAALGADWEFRAPIPRVRLASD
jgi:hypothetical protein